MWLTLLVMAAAVSLEPFRIGMCAVLLNRPQPRRQLAAFLAGGFLMGLTVGATVLFAVAPRLPASAQFTLPTVQIVIGVLALLTAVAVAATRTRAREPSRWLTRLLGSRSFWVAGVAGLGIALPSVAYLAALAIWVAGVAGLGIALPSVDYLAALAIIAAAGVPPATQLSAVVLFNVVAFALVEIPLVADLVAPARTRAAISTLHRWVRTRRRRDLAALLGAVGVVLIVAGLLGR